MKVGKIVLLNKLMKFGLEEILLPGNLVKFKPFRGMIGLLNLNNEPIFLVKCNWRENGSFCDIVCLHKNVLHKRAFAAFSAKVEKIT